jgi:dynein heavy chain, axonemal
MASLPLLEDPEVFGLHENANITMDLQKTQALLDALLLAQNRCGGGSGSAAAKPVDDVLYDTAADILAKLPQEFDLETAQRKYPVMYGESMNTVLCQELVRANALLQQIGSSLRELKKAVRGLILLSADLEKVRTFRVHTPKQCFAPSYSAAFAQDIAADWIFYAGVEGALRGLFC